MLSRVAERVYWMGRYVERAESTARLVNAYTSQMMDLPRGVEAGWKHLVEIMGSTELFETRASGYDERGTGSILSSIARARENVRRSRDVLPTEAWEYSNELFLYARANADGVVTRGHRFSVLKQIVSRCQQLTGLLEGTMSHDVAYEFVGLGRNLERADMTTRIVDSAVYLLLPRRTAPGTYDTILWMSVLRSLSAYQMYRQHVRSRVEGDEVVCFLLCDRNLPRAVWHALAESERSLGILPRNADALRSLANVRNRIHGAMIGAMSLDDLHHLIDEVQSDLAEVHKRIRTTWFTVECPVVRQSQSQVRSAPAGPWRSGSASSM
jgi:uncharacterized alpha-E superfamily protein